EPPVHRRHRMSADAAPCRRCTTASGEATPGRVETTENRRVRPGRAAVAGPGRTHDFRRKLSGAFLKLDEGATALGSKLLEGWPGESARENVAVLPAADRGEGHAQGMGEALLGETGTVTPSADELASICGGTARDAGVVGGGSVELHSEVHLAAAQSN